MVYLYTFFNFGARINGWSMQRHSPFTSKNGTQCSLYWHRMGLWAEAMYLYTFFSFGARIGGFQLPRPGRFIPKKDIRYPMFWTLNGSLDPSGIPLFFLTFGTRIGGWSMSRIGNLPLGKRPGTHFIGRSKGLCAEAEYRNYFSYFYTSKVW